MNAVDNFDGKNTAERKMTIPLTKETRIAILKRKLAVAIEEEEYLLAARLRDQINEITDKN